MKDCWGGGRLGAVWLLIIAAAVCLPSCISSCMTPWSVTATANFEGVSREDVIATLDRLPEFERTGSQEFNEIYDSGNFRFQRLSIYVSEYDAVTYIYFAPSRIRYSAERLSIEEAERRIREAHRILHREIDGLASQEELRFLYDGIEGRK